MKNTASKNLKQLALFATSAGLSICLGACAATSNGVGGPLEFKAPPVLEHFQGRIPDAYASDDTVVTRSLDRWPVGTKVIYDGVARNANLGVGKRSCNLCLFAG